jgi:bifunctional non-homologous end joining protein LigD
VGLTPFVKTTGSKGLHLLAPLDRSEDFDTVRKFAHDLARVLAVRHPDRLTVNPHKEKRKGKIFLDYLRNSYAQTAAPPYSVRAREGAPVAAPVDWDEVGGNLSPTQYTIKNIQRRLSQKNDPWSGIMRHARSLKEPLKKLQGLIEEIEAEH